MLALKYNSYDHKQYCDDKPAASIHERFLCKCGYSSRSNFQPSNVHAGPACKHAEGISCQILSKCTNLPTYKTNCSDGVNPTSCGTNVWTYLQGAVKVLGEDFKTENGDFQAIELMLNS